jgi:hypothetical protein
MQQQRHAIQVLIVLASLFVTSQSSAVIVQLDFTLSFGDTPAVGPAPWLDAEFDDSVGDATTVRLSVDGLGSLQAADITELYFNLNPLLDPTALTFTRVAAQEVGTIGAITVSTGTDGFKADGDGHYDVRLELPTANNDAGRFSAKETLVYDISYSGALSAADFYFLSASGAGGNSGPFLAAAHLQSTGADLQGSDWVAAVPLPAALWLFASGLAMAGFASRRRNR